VKQPVPSNRKRAKDAPLPDVLDVGPASAS